MTWPFSQPVLNWNCIVFAQVESEYAVELINQIIQFLKKTSQKYTSLQWINNSFMSISNAIKYKLKLYQQINLFHVLSL